MTELFENNSDLLRESTNRSSDKLALKEEIQSIVRDILSEHHHIHIDFKDHNFTNIDVTV